MWLNMAFAVYRSRRRSVTLYRLLYTVWVKEHRRFYQIKSRSQAGANIRLFSRSKIKMIAINSRTSARTLPIFILLYGYEEIKSDSYTSTDNEIQNICTKSLFGYRFTLFFRCFFLYLEFLWPPEILLLLIDSPKICEKYCAQLIMRQSTWKIHKARAWYGKSIWNSIEMHHNACVA